MCVPSSGCPMVREKELIADRVFLCGIFFVIIRAGRRCGAGRGGPGPRELGQGPARHPGPRRAGGEPGATIQTSQRG